MYKLSQGHRDPFERSLSLEVGRSGKRNSLKPKQKVTGVTYENSIYPPKVERNTSKMPKCNRQFDSY